MADQSGIDYEEEGKFPWNFKVYQPFDFLDVASMVMLGCLNQQLDLPLLARMMPVELNNVGNGAYTSIRYYDKETKETIIRGSHGGTWVEAITMTIVLDGYRYTVRVIKEKIHTTGLDNELSVHHLVLSIIESIQGLYQALSYATTGSMTGKILACFPSGENELVPIEEIDHRLDEMGLLIRASPEQELTEEQDQIRLLIHLLKCHYIEKNNLSTPAVAVECTNDLISSISNDGELFDEEEEEFVRVKCSDVCNKISWTQWLKQFLQVVANIKGEVLYAGLAPSYYYKGNIYYSFNIPFSINTEKLMTVYNQVKPDFMLEYNPQLSTSIRFEVEYNLHPDMVNYVTKRNNRRRINICFTVNGVATFTGPCQSLMRNFYKIVMDFLYVNRARIEDYSSIQNQRKVGTINLEKVYRRYYFQQRHKVDELLVDPDVLDSCHCEDDHLPEKLPRFPLIELSTGWAT